MIRNNLLRKIELHIKRLIFGNKIKNKERNILKSICKGKGADIGCGSKKVSENCIGIDLVGKGQAGKYGSQKGKPCVADYQSSGDNLTMFKNNELDFIVASHNLEHYKNPLKTIKEWRRVLKKQGKIGVVVPDNDFVVSRTLDPTHHYDFNLCSLERLFKKAGFKILQKGRAINHWSIYLIAQKPNSKN